MVIINAQYAREYTGYRDFVVEFLIETDNETN